MTIRFLTDTTWRWAASLCAITFVGWLLNLTYRPPVLLIWAIGAAVVCLGSRAVSRWASPAESWPAFVRRTWDVHALLLALLYWLAVQQVRTAGITSDGCLYFAHMRSLIFDGDLSIDPELAVLQLGDRPHHIVAIGPAVVWAPLYLAVAAVDWLGHALGAWVRPEDLLARTLTGAYARAAMVGTFLTAAVGMLIMHGRLRQEFGAPVALVTSLLLFAATPLVYYVVHEPAMTHAVSFGLVAIFLVVAEQWCRASPPTPRRAILLGALLGLAILVRPQNALFGVFPLVFGGGRAWETRDWRADARSMAWLVVATVPFILAQAVFYQALLAGEPYILAGERGYLRVFEPRLLDVLFSSWHGLFSWTPVAYVAAIGTACYAGRDRRWGSAALMLFLAMWWVNASAEDWAGGVAFGGRRFTSTLAALAPGLALAIAAMHRRPGLLVAGLAALAIQWNTYLMVQYNEGMVSKTGVVSFTDVIQRQAQLATRAPFVYPFAFPANAWFAWRHDLPADRYDLLGPEPFVRAFRLPLDEAAGRFLLDGWGDAERPRGTQPFRRTSSRGASLAIPLDRTAEAGVTIEVTARAWSRAVAVDDLVVDLTANGRPVGRLTFGTNIATQRLVFDPIEAGRVWRHGYNRLELELVQVVSVERARVGAEMYDTRVTRRPAEIGAQLAVEGIVVGAIE